jgi:hypothetical protein
MAPRLPYCLTREKQPGGNGNTEAAMERTRNLKSGLKAAAVAVFLRCASLNGMRQQH